MTLVSSVLLGTLFYWLLRRLAFERWEAGVITAMALLFPLADSVRLFATGAVNPLATAAVLAGVLIALRGLVEQGVRRILLRVGSLLCMAAAPLIYESAIPFACVSYFVYRRVAPRRTAVWWWLGDVVVTIGVTAVARSLATTREVGSVPLGQQLRHAVVIAYEAPGVFAFSILPQLTQIVTARHAVIFTLLAAVIVAATARAALRLARRDEHAAATLTRWLRVAAWAAAATTVAYLAFVPGGLGEYHPLARGEGTRINVSVALPMAVLVFAFLRVLATVVAYRMRAPARELRIAQTLTAILLVLYVATVEIDAHRWLQTSDDEAALTNRLETVLPAEPADLTVFVIGKADLASPGVPGYIDDATLSIGPDISVPTDRRELQGYLLSPAAKLRCERAEIVSSGDPPAHGPASKTWEYDTRTGRLRQLQMCQRRS